MVVRDKRRSNSAGKHAADQPNGGSGKHAADDDEPATGKHAAEGKPSAGHDAASEPAPKSTGEVHQPAAGGLGAELDALRGELDDRTRDLQRINSEYANYRRRVERDRAVAADEATAAVFRALLPVFDDLDRARDHGELSDGVAAIVDQLAATAGKFGLAAFGEQGDPFDPTHHEAVAHLTSAEVTEPTCVDVLRRGYSLGDRLLRPAMVAVADPGESGAGPAGEASPTADADSDEPGSSESP
ncbi:nucleotide exchange factor GrpE [Natronosporangium hydrolyticum]|uniref:Protein GrpE n=1 Tax=Natronosporangium hydrolyticum TaxID=2811111 RepID=A0A895YSP0_9ACTN|nr:nucleotide exchange factor GrpE [Natronosporangium hydrolyticum]